MKVQVPNPAPAETPLRNKKGGVFVSLVVSVVVIDTTHDTFAIRTTGLFRCLSCSPPRQTVTALLGH